MIKVYYDPISNGFYQTDIHKSIPSTALIISDDKRSELLNGVAEGKDIAVKENNELVLVNKVLDENELVYGELKWRDAELLRADIELYKVQDGDPKAKGTVAQWREYRKSLRALPENKEFPKPTARPLAPDI